MSRNQSKPQRCSTPTPGIRLHGEIFFSFTNCSNVKLQSCQTQTGRAKTPMCHLIQDIVLTPQHLHELSSHLINREVKGHKNSWRISRRSFHRYRAAGRGLQVVTSPLKKMHLFFATRDFGNHRRHSVIPAPLLTGKLGWHCHWAPQGTVPSWLGSKHLPSLTETN